MPEVWTLGTNLGRKTQTRTLTSHYRLLVTIAGVAPKAVTTGKERTDEQRGGGSGRNRGAFRATS